MRRMWGCDEPTRDPVFATTGKKWYRCPTAVLVEDRSRFVSVSAFLDSYLCFDESGRFPVEGGWLDQTAAWCAAVAVVRIERSRWERIQNEYLESKQNG